MQVVYRDARNRKKFDEIEREVRQEVLHIAKA